VSNNKQAPGSAGGVGGVGRIRVRGNNAPGAVGIQIPDIDSKLVVLDCSREEQEVPAIRQELGPAMSNLPTYRVDPGGRSRLSTGGGDAVQRSERTRGEDDFPRAAPASPSSQSGLA